MISFDLRCGNDHVFEAWFNTSVAYEDQRARRLIACPLCADPNIAKAIMAPAVAMKTSQRAASSKPGISVSSETVETALAAVAKLGIEMKQPYVYVGDRFADEARAIQHGEADHRAIYGEATVAEALALREEGIEVVPLPLPTRRIADA